MNGYSSSTMEYRYNYQPVPTSAHPILIVNGASSLSTSSSASSASNSSSLASSPKNMTAHHQPHTPTYLLATLKHRLMAAAAAAAHIEGSSSPDDHISYSSQSSSDDPMPESSNSPSTGSSSSSARANRFFPDQVVDILNRWFVQNADYPYPDEHMTNVLAKEANISAKQVRKWFANKRVRSNKCFKQTFKAKKEAVANRARLHAV